MAPLFQKLKNLIHGGGSTRNGNNMKPRDSGTSLNSNAHSRVATGSSSKAQSVPVSRDTSPTRTTNTNHHTHHHTPSEAPQEPVKTTHSTGNNTAFGHSSNTEAATRMVAEENQQKSKMPVYPGLERFKLIEKMGDGAFSNVYKALDSKTGKTVAVKVVRKFELNAQQNKHLHRDMKRKPRVTERANILKEVQIMRQLKHPGIIELYEFSESDEHYFLVLELAPGGELFHRIVKLTYFSEELTRHVIIQVAQAIRYLHEEKGVIHRDIKPENILFEPIPIIPSPPGAKPDEDDKEDEGVFQAGIGGGGIGRVKIADFGLSKVVWNEQTMTPCGTVGYTAPEIVKDERYSKSVDMWAMGCVLYTLLCGFPPFYDESIQALTEKVARGQYTFLSPWWDEISTEVKDLISHLLCVNPNERYTIDQFLAHPWIKAGESSEETPAGSNVPAIAIDAPRAGFAENKKLANVAAMTPEYGAPRTPYKRRAENPLSPGIGLKEVFDVSNAVHRMEEESSRRRHVQSGLNPGDALNTTTRERQAFMSQLNEEDELEEEDDQGSYSDGSRQSMSEDESVVASMNDVQIGINSRHGASQSQDSLQQQQHDYQKAQEGMAAERHQKYLHKQQMAGHSIPSQHTMPRTVITQPPNSTSNQTLSTSTSTSTVGSNASTSTARRRAGFELNMNQATLLNRRAKHQLGHPFQQQEQIVS